MGLTQPKKRISTAHSARTRFTTKDAMMTEGVSSEKICVREREGYDQEKGRRPVKLEEEILLLARSGRHLHLHFQTQYSVSYKRLRR